MDVGVATIVFAVTALVVGAVSEMVIRRWLASAIAGIVCSQAVFLWMFGLPKTITELLIPMLFSAVLAILGVWAAATVMQRKGLS